MICNLLIYRSSKKQVPDNSHETLACGLKLSLSLSPSVSPLSLPWSGCPRQAIDGSNQQQWWLKCSGNRSIWAFASCSSFYPLIWQFWIEISDSACVPSLLASLKSQVLACSLFEFGNFWCSSFEKYRCDLMRALELDFMVFGFLLLSLQSLLVVNVARLWSWVVTFLLFFGLLTVFNYVMSFFSFSAFDNLISCHGPHGRACGIGIHTNIYIWWSCLGSFPVFAMYFFIL